MGIETLLKPFKWVDEQILTQYTKLTKRFEERGVNKYRLSGLFLGSSYLFTVGTALVMNNAPTSEINRLIEDDFWIKIKASVGTLTYSGTVIHDSMYTSSSVMKTEIMAGEAAEHPFLHYSKKFQRAVRLPLAVYTADIWYRLGKHFYHEGINGLDEPGIAGLGVSLMFASLVSSMYVKDSDPKLLEKKPIRKRAGECIRDIFLKPIPHPVKFKSDSLEEYINF